jgi:hypothetical protein
MEDKNDGDLSGDLTDRIFDVQADLAVLIPMSHWDDEPTALTRNGVHRALRRAIDHLESIKKYSKK